MEERRSMLITPPKKLQTEIVLPASKSISNRALIMCALSGGGTEVQNVSDCDDSRVVVEALDVMPGLIDIKAAGTAMRFLTSLLTTVGGEHVITGTERMRNRPIAVLVDALRAIGADIEYVEKEGFPPLRIRGGSRPAGGSLSLPGNVSSQYISSLMMIGPTLAEGLTLELTGEILSRPYIEMTMAMMRQFGAKVQWTSDREIRVEAVPYQPVPYSVESDWSAASYWYEMTALSGDGGASVRLPGLFRESLQGDSAVAALFADLGVGTEYNEDDSVTLRKCGTVTGQFCKDLSGQPDLAQTFVVTCCMMGVPFRITGLRTLRIKETDRIAALQRELAKLGYEVGCEGDDTMFWDTGMRCEPDSTAGIDTYEDHRMAMAFAPVALCTGEVRINNPQVVTKSYPRYWDDLTKAGFRCSL